MLDINLNGQIGRAPPRPGGDGTWKPLRTDRYGALLVSPSIITKHSLVDEGVYYTTTNSTLGTALAAGVAATFSDTSSAIHIYNGADVNDSNSLRIYLDYVKFNVTVAPASATGWGWKGRLDNQPRTPTAGTTRLTGNTGSPGAFPPGPALSLPLANVYAFNGGAFQTIPAAGVLARTAGTGGGGGLPVVGTELSVRFGSDAGPSGGPNNSMSVGPPVAIAPGWSFAFHLWFPGNATTGLSAEVEVAWWER